MFLQRKVVQLFKIKHKYLHVHWIRQLDTATADKLLVLCSLDLKESLFPQCMREFYPWDLRPLKYLSTSPISTFTQTLWDLPRTPCRVTWCCCPLSERTEEMRSGTERGTSVFIHFFCVVYHIISPYTRDLCSDTGQKSGSFLLFVWRLCCQQDTCGPNAGS